VRLHSPAPAPRPAAGVTGRVLDAGDPGRGKHEGIRVDIQEPSWLILGESWNKGWRAECDGRDLGEPEVVDGFANGWRVDRGCRNVAFTFGPQGVVNAAYVVGGLGCLLLAVALFVSWRRKGRQKSPPAGGLPPLAEDRPVPMPLARAAAIALAVAGIGAFLFALRAGPAIALGVFLILWRGIPTNALVAAAGALLAVVVPALYLLFPSIDRGGYNTEYAEDHLGAHWVAVAAIVLLAVALVRTLSTASRRRGARAPEPAAEPAQRAPA
jgi:hypothetical protein